MIVVLKLEIVLSGNPKLLEKNIDFMLVYRLMLHLHFECLRHTAIMTAPCIL